MPISDKQRQTVLQLISLSNNARVIADRLDVSLSAESDLATLRKQVAQMGDQLASLSQTMDEMSDPDAEFTDEEAHDFNVGFARNLDSLDFRQIVSFYDTKYLRAYPKNIRVLVCTCLLNNFKSRNLTSLPVWESVVANNGSLS